TTATISFRIGQRPFHFSTDPLSGFRMPPIGNCQSASNTHWGYGSATAYSPYLASSGCLRAQRRHRPNLIIQLWASRALPMNSQIIKILLELPTVICVPMLPDSTASDLDQHLSIFGCPHTVKCYITVY
ncbi:hypothetical protein DOY81_008593, partial [Sarcophaga bullata]